MWVADNIYGPNMEHLRNLESRYGIHVKVYNSLMFQALTLAQKPSLFG